jgi:hypothetical protein
MVICPRCQAQSAGQETHCLSCGLAFEIGTPDSALSNQPAALALESQSGPPKTESSEADPRESTLSRWAVASFAFGLFAWLLVFNEHPVLMRLIYSIGGDRTLFAVTALFALLGIAAGHKALINLRASQALQTGRGLALFGLLINYLFLLFSALVLYINISMNAF